MSKILIVEDEVELAHVMAKYLEAEGFEVHQLHQGIGVVEWVLQHEPDVILLDWMLPGRDGISICKEVMELIPTPTIMLTAKIDEIDRLIGLDSGAVDYVCKPYSAKEVVARVKVQLRMSGRPIGHNPLSINQILVKADEHSVSFGENTIELTAVEFNLLNLFYQRPGKIFSRQQIMDNVYQDYRVVSNRTIDSHIRNLRKKLNDLVPDQELIQSIYSVGYKYQPL